MKVNSGIRRARQIANSLRVCGSTPFAASISITAASAASSVRYVSSPKSWCPGVSSRFIVCPSYGNCRTVEVIEMPRSRSSSIQSEVAARARRRAATCPAVTIAPPYRRSFSVSVVLPASG